MIRYPQHAGTFYPDTKEGIIEIFSKFEIQGKNTNVDVKTPIGLIAPHAGYIYSGFVAYITYKNAFKSREFSNIIILGPSHYVYFKGVSIFPEGSWVTPMGEVEINTKITLSLSQKSSYFSNSPDLHRREHSIEVQIPFVQHFNPNAKIVPLLVGEMNDMMVDEVGRALAEVLLENQDTLIVASSDLYHGESYRACVESDRNTIDLILNGDWRKIYAASKTGEIMACGDLPISILMSALERVNPDHTRSLVFYTNSGDVTGVRSGYVVGYAGILFGI